MASRDTWPELVGKGAEEAKTTILEQNPNFQISLYGIPRPPGVWIATEICPLRMSHDCWRYNSSGAAIKTAFSCSCGCCGDDYRRYCCDTSFCDPSGTCSGIYLSRASVVVLICVSCLILLGAGVALVLVCRMKSRPGRGNSAGTPQEKSEETLESDKDYSNDDERRNSDHPYYIYPDLPLPQDVQIQKKLQQNTQLRPQAHGQMSCC